MPDIEQIALQEQRLQFEHFDAATAWELGTLLKTAAERRGVAVAIDIQLHGQPLFFFAMPVVSHLLPEIHVHLIAGIPNGLTVEYMPWTLPFFEETPAIEGEDLVVPQKPGLGLAFDRDAIKRYEIGSSTIS
jgi:L-alanine-DL-glutamate epimerase-like enolase superfamily enzyme